jgi:hypothetical protein
MSVEFGQWHAVGYFGSNTAWLPRACWLAMSPEVRDLLRHRAQGEHDMLQPGMCQRMQCGTAYSVEDRLAAEVPLPLEGSPVLTAGLEQAGLLSEVRRRCTDMQRLGYCKLGANTTLPRQPPYTQT